MQNNSHFRKLETEPVERVMDEFGCGAPPSGDAVILGNEFHTAPEDHAWANFVLQDIDEGGTIREVIDGGTIEHGARPGVPHSAANPMATAEQPPPDSPCWGFLLSGGTSDCTPGFSAEKGHFRKRICPACIRDGVYIEYQRVRIYDEALSSVNNSSHGLWSSRFGCDVRVINQTARCIGTPLIVFRDAESAASLGLHAVPDSWHRSGYLHFTVSNGTLVPSKSLALCAGSHTITGSTGASSPSSLSSSQLALELMPSALVPSQTCSPDGSEDMDLYTSSHDYGDRGSESSFAKRARREQGATCQGAAHHDSASSMALRMARCTSDDDGGQAGSGSAAVVQPSLASLLPLASSQAQLTTHLTRTLDLAASESDDPHVAEYLARLQSAIGPLAEASSLLQRAVDSRQAPLLTAATSPEGLSREGSFKRKASPSSTDSPSAGASAMMLGMALSESSQQVSGPLPTASCWMPAARQLRQAEAVQSRGEPDNTTKVESTSAESVSAGVAPAREDMWSAPSSCSVSGVASALSLSPSDCPNVCPTTSPQIVDRTDLMLLASSLAQLLTQVKQLLAEAASEVSRRPQPPLPTHSLLTACAVSCTLNLPPTPTPRLCLVHPLAPSCAAITPQEPLALYHTALHRCTDDMLLATEALSAHQARTGGPPVVVVGTAWVHAAGRSAERMLLASSHAQLLTHVQQLLRGAAGDVEVRCAPLDPAGTPVHTLVRCHPLLMIRS